MLKDLTLKKLVFLLRRKKQFGETLLSISPLIIAILIIPFFIIFKIEKKLLPLIALAGAIFLIFLIYPRDKSYLLNKYTFSIFDPRHHFIKENINKTDLLYAEKDISKYKKDLKKKTFLSLPPDKPNIIFLIVESLSAIDSKKIGGVYDYLPEFDKLAEQGTLFTNFFANHKASEGGVLSYLIAQPPYPFPYNTRDLYLDYQYHHSIFNDLKEDNYTTAYITPTDLRFMHKIRFLRNAEIDHLVGRDQSELFKNAPRTIFHSPSDKYLYKGALPYVKKFLKEKNKFFMTLVTITTHVDMKHPEGKDNSHKEIWDWTIEQMISFYKKLTEINFLKMEY